MNEPAGYPANDEEEHLAIALFESTIDPKYIKTEIQKRDKFPNVDGFVEVVTEKANGVIPIGKLEVQIKKLPKGQLRYDCPSSLVAYSEKVTTLPVLLICSDPDTKRVFWAHVRRSMPEYKTGQQTFTIKFDPSVDIIDSSNTYIRRWMEIVTEYQQRVSTYPELQFEVVEKFGLKSVDVKDVRYFQEFIDCLNNLLDRDFPVLKNRYFGDAWKLGVGILNPAGMDIAYQIYRIPYGASSPLVISLSDLKFADLFSFSSTPHPQDGRQVVPRGCELVNVRALSQRATPFDAAKDFVFDILERALKNKALRLSGYTLSVESLFHFLDGHAHTVGLAAVDEYEVPALNYGFKVFLPAWYKLALNRYLREHDALIKQTGMFPRFENISGMFPENLRPTIDETKAFIASNKDSLIVPLIPLFFPASALFEAVDYLAERGIDRIARPYPKRAPIPGPIWAGYSVGDLRAITQAVLLNLFEAYKSLLVANQIYIPKSRYLDPDVAFVYFADFDAWASGESHPVLTHFCVQNPEHILPKVTIIESPEARKQERVLINGKEYQMVYGGWTSAFDLFHRLPLLKCVYGMLANDLNAKYDSKLLATDGTLLI